MHNCEINFLKLLAETQSQKQNPIQSADTQKTYRKALYMVDRNAAFKIYFGQHITV